MRTKRNSWTINSFRALLKSYLTEPEFAEKVVELGENRLSVKLDDGSRFFISVTRPAG